jgi:electron transfer flavoprotein alpha subunit
MTRVLAVLEARDGRLRAVSNEIVTAARALADALGGTVEALVCAADEVVDASSVGVYGADTVGVLTHQAFARYSPDGFGEALAARAASSRAVVFAATATGRDLAPRVAARLERSLATEVTEVGVDGSAVTATRPVYAGKAHALVKLTGEPALLSVRPGVFTPREDARPGTLSIEPVTLSAAPRVVVREVKAPPSAQLDVAEASIVVSGGRGLQDPSNFAMLERLAAALGRDAAVGASRAVVDAGWRPHAEQVGQTGKTVSPQLYFAVGISGAVQHLAGMRTAKVIVAINKDRDAPIFKIADYGIVGDLFEIVPRLTEELEKIAAS